jgi:hypothetical protein
MRDDLLRMAPRNCALKTANLTYISSTPGTAENTSAATSLWQPGQPAPPWAYEYQYPVDCLRAVYIVPAGQSSGDLPVGLGNGGAISSWSGPPVRFKVITLPYGPITSAPIGAPVQLRVLTAPAGVVGTVDVVNVILGQSPSHGGSYFAPQTGTIAQDTTTGSGVGATFTLTFSTKEEQRVILTNQQSATLGYCRQVTNPNVMDTLFQTAWINLLGGGLAMALRGNRDLANDLVKEVNTAIEAARSIDGNEGLTVNDVTPDWIRCRGVAFDNITGPLGSFDWGPLWPNFM